jgi:hypothetical protein
VHDRAGVCRRAPRNSGVNSILRASARGAAADALQAGAVADHRKLFALGAGIALIALDLGVFALRSA